MKERFVFTLRAGLLLLNFTGLVFLVLSGGVKRSGAVLIGLSLLALGNFFYAAYTKNRWGFWVLMADAVLLIWRFVALWLRLPGGNFWGLFCGGLLFGIMIPLLLLNFTQYAPRHGISPPAVRAVKFWLPGLVLAELYGISLIAFDQMLHMRTEHLYFVAFIAPELQILFCAAVVFLIAELLRLMLLEPSGERRENLRRGTPVFVIAALLSGLSLWFFWSFMRGGSLVPVLQTIWGGVPV